MNYFIGEMLQRTQHEESLLKLQVKSFHFAFVCFCTLTTSLLYSTLLKKLDLFLGSCKFTLAAHLSTDSLFELNGQFCQHKKCIRLIKWINVMTENVEKYCPNLFRNFTNSIFKKFSYVDCFSVFTSNSITITVQKKRPPFYAFQHLGLRSPQILLSTASLYITVNNRASY